MWYDEEFWSQTRAVPLTAQSFASYASMASYWTSLSFDVFVCKNHLVIPPFQVDVTSNWDHALKASGSLDINSILVHLSFPSLSSWCLRPCLHHLGGSPTDTVLHKVHLQHIHARTHTHWCHPFSSIKTIQDHWSPISVLLPSLYFLLSPFTGQKTIWRMDKKRKWHCRGKKEATSKGDPKSPGRSENLTTRSENARRLGKIRWENYREADHGGPCRTCTGRGPSSSHQQSAMEWALQEGVTLWFVFRCMGVGGGCGLGVGPWGRQARESGTIAQQAKITDTCRTLSMEREPEDQWVSEFSSFRKLQPITD